ncbi:hypothetical protein ACKKBF_B14155 [Auxenochlorella protothecoides x Auxenochlorella symbiontica]
MVWCSACTADVEPDTEAGNGFSCCPHCGRVLEDTAFSADVTFQKDAGGESTVLGQFVSETGQARGIGRIHGGRVYTSQTDSHERAQQKGRHQIAQLVEALKIRPREESVESAHRLYRLALQRGFTRGRRTNQVAATCLYLLCRQDAKPFLLIDFSDRLQINVFTLGSVFLQLARLLRMEDHPMFCKPIDPSLFIDRYTNLLGLEQEVSKAIAHTAVRLVASMKRDWIQTGRRPSGICGAALFIATHIHGVPRTKQEVIRVVNVGEATLSRRLQEFSATDTGGLTLEGLEERHEQLVSSQDQALALPPPATQGARMITGPSGGGGCEHIKVGHPPFAHGMCATCYVDFLKRTGGLHGGANPPAFAKAREREQQAAILALEAPPPAPEEEGEETEEQAALAADMAQALRAAELRPFRRLLDGGDGDEDEDGEAGMGGDEEAGAEERSAREVVLDGAGTPGAQGDRVTRSRGLATAGLATAATPSPSAGQGAKAGQRGSVPDPAAPRLGEALSPGPGSAPSSSTAGAQPTEGAAPQTSPASAQSKRPRAVFQRWKPRKATAASRERGGRQAAGDGESRMNPDPASNAEQSADGASGGTASLPGRVDAGGDPASGRAVQPLSSCVDQTTVSGAELMLLPPGAGDAAARADGDQDGALSDIPDDDIDMYIADSTEVAFKEEIWNMMNRDWLERQAAKAAVAAATEKAAAEQRAAQEAAEAAGVAYKRSRGRPLGSKSKTRAESALPPAETPQEAAMRMLDNRKLSSKINYNVLADLFDDAPSPASAVGPGAGGPEEPRQPGAEAAVAAKLSASQDRQSAALSAELRASRTAGNPLGGLGSLQTGSLGSLRPSGLNTSLSRSRLSGGVATRARPSGLSSPKGDARRVRFAPS